MATESTQYSRAYSLGYAAGQRTSLRTIKGLVDYSEVIREEREEAARKIQISLQLIAGDLKEELNRARRLKAGSDSQLSDIENAIHAAISAVNDADDLLEDVIHNPLRRNGGEVSAI